jgi:hypothetical protein
VKEAALTHGLTGDRTIHNDEKKCIIRQEVSRLPKHPFLVFAAKLAVWTDTKC